MNWRIYVPTELFEGDPHAPDRWTLALSLWVAIQRGTANVRQQLVRLVVRNEASLKAWQAEDQARRSYKAGRAVCRDCGARHLEHFYTSGVGGSTLCQWCFQSRVTRGLARERER